MEMIIPQSLLMTSREIAELTGKEHRNVARDTRAMLQALKLNLLSFEQVYRAGNGQSQTEYLLPKDLTLTLVSGYNVVMRKRIIDRWLELEMAPQPFELSRMDLIQLALRAETENIALAAKIAIDAPKVRFAETIRAIDGVCHIEKVAKTIGIGRTKFFRRLREDHILISGSNLPYQKYIDKGYFTVIEGNPFSDSKGVEHPTFTAMVTGAGQVFLVRKYAKAGEAES